MPNANNAQANVDEAEIHKFERMAARWWDRQGEFKPLHDINPLRANYIDLNSNGTAGKLLDIGCGGGILSEAMAQRGALVTGIDMGEAPLEVARLHALESKLDIRYEQNSAENFAEAHSQAFDIVCCMEMLEHVPDPASVIRACAELCSSGGNLFFSTINRTPKAYAYAVLGAEYILKWLPKGTHEYKKFIQPAELASWIRLAGLDLKDMSGMVYHPFSKEYSIKQHDLQVNYIVHAQKP